MEEPESFLEKVKADFKANFSVGNPKLLFCVLFYRISSLFAQSPFILIKIVGYPIRLSYRVIIEWVMGVEIPDLVVAGGGIRFHHGVGLVINPKVILGKNVTLRHCTTIGCKMSYEGKCLGSPIIEDNVNIGPHVVIFGEITIGKNAIIGAGSVVFNDVPPFAIVAGNPAKIIKILNH